MNCCLKKLTIYIINLGLENLGKIMSDQKKHFYLVHGSFKNPALGHDIDQSFNGDINLSSTKITKSVLEEVRISLENYIQNKNPQIKVVNFRINSISYLGEMTKEEFNS